MTSWFGLRVIDNAPINPGAPLLEGPFPDYQAAKAARERSRARDMQHTSIFSAPDASAAYEQLARETWTQL